MKKTIGVLFTVIFFLVLFRTDPFQLLPSKTKVNISHKQLDSFVNLAELGKRQELINKTEEFYDDFLNQNTFTRDVYQMLHVVISDLVKKASNDEATTDEVVSQVYRLYLFLDALEEHQDPLWKEKKADILSASKQLISLNASGNDQDFAEGFRKFEDEYNYLYSAMYVNVDAELLNRVDNHVQYIDYYLEARHTNTMFNQRLHSLYEELNRVFADAKHDQVSPSFFSILIYIGSAVAITLSYVGWRKYKGETGKQKSKQHSK